MLTLCLLNMLLFFVCFAARALAFCAITVIGHAAMAAVLGATTGTFRFQPKICVIVVYDVFHVRSLLCTILVVYSTACHKGRATSTTRTFEMQEVTVT